MGYRPVSASFDPCSHTTLTQFTEQACQHEDFWLHESLFICTGGTATQCTSSAVLPTVQTMWMRSPLVGTTRCLFPNNIHPGLLQSFWFLHQSSTQLYSTACPPHSQHHPPQLDKTHLMEGKTKCLSKKEKDQVVHFKQTGLGSFFFQ